MTEFELLDTLLPPNIKLAMQMGYADKIATATMGIERFEFGDIAYHLGTKVAARRRRYRPVARGLLALQELKG